VAGLGITGLLLAYNPRAALISIQLFDGRPHELQLATVLIVVGLLLVPAWLLLSLAALHAAGAAAGERRGRLLWLAAGLALHWPLICGLPEAGWPITLGATVERLLAIGVATADHAYTIAQVLLPIVSLGLAALVVALVAVLLVQRMRLVPLEAASPLPLAVAGGLAAAAVRALTLAALWTADARYSDPGDWRALFATGIVTAALLYAAQAQLPSRRSALGAQLGWTAALAAGLAGMTLPQLLADTAARGEIIAAVLAAWGGMALLFALADALGAGTPAFAWPTVTALLAAALVPLRPAAPAPLLGAIATLRAGLLDPDSAPAAWRLAAAIVLAALVCWLMQRSAIRRPAAPPTPATRSGGRGHRPARRR
jgi:hypothetical protein